MKKIVISVATAVMCGNLAWAGGALQGLHAETQTLGLDAPQALPAPQVSGACYILAQAEQRMASLQDAQRNLKADILARNLNIKKQVDVARFNSYSSLDGKTDQEIIDYALANSGHFDGCVSGECAALNEIIGDKTQIQVDNSELGDVESQMAQVQENIKSLSAQCLGGS